jgi:hypothetical protein
MSNRVDPKLNTILDPLPKENIIKPLNMRSKNFDSFPPLKTPKLQPLNKDSIKFVGLRNLPKDRVSKKIKKSVKKIKNKQQNKQQNILQNISQLILYFFIFLIILTILKFLINKK